MQRITVTGFFLLSLIVGVGVAQAQERGYGLVQTGATNGRAYALGAEFGAPLAKNLQVYLAGGWLEDQGLHLTSGAKILIPTTGRITPYVLGGLGAFSFRSPKVPAKNRFLPVAGFGLAYPVSQAGYLDVSYRYMKPHDMPGTISGLYAGVGFRY